MLDSEPRTRVSGHGVELSLSPTQADENGWFSTEWSRDCRMIYREFA